MKKTLKRIMAAILTFLLISSCVVAFADNYINVSESGETTITSRQLPESDRLKPDGKPMAFEYNAISFQTNYELTFRVNVTKHGVYELFLGIGTKATDAKKFAVTLDDGAPQNVTATGGNGTNKTAEYRSVTALNLDTGNHIIKVKSVNASLYFHGIKLKMLSAGMEFAAISANGVTDMDAVPSGVDSIKVEFTESLNDDTVSADTVSLTYEENGETKYVDADFVAEEKAIKVIIKEALKPNCLYSVLVDGVTDKYALTTITKQSYPFNTVDADIKNGTIKADVSVDYENVLITGKYISSEDVGIKGRNIKLYFSEDDETPVEETVTGENGEFKIEYVFGEDKESRVYTLLVDGDFAKKPCSFDISYISRAKELELIGSIKDMESWEDVEAFFNDYENIIGIDSQSETENIPDVSLLYGKMLGKAYENADAVRNDFYKLVALETINQATDKETVDIILSNEEQCEILGLDYEKIHTVKDNYDEILDEVLALESQEDAKALKEMIDPIAEKWSVSYIDVEDSGETKISVNKLGEKDRVSADGTTLGLIQGAAFVSYNPNSILNYRVNIKTRGVYELLLCVADTGGQNKNYGITINGGEETVVSAAGGQGWYTPVRNTVLNLKLEKGSNTIKIRNVNASLHFESIVLKMLATDMHLLDVKANGIDLDSAVSNGTDSILFSFSELLDEKTVTNETVTLTYEEEGKTKVAAKELKVSDKVLAVAIKETLKPNCTYTVTIDGVTDKYSFTTVKNQVVTFNTVESDIKNGTIEATAVLDYDKAKITGKYVSSEGVGIKGRNIKFYLSEIGTSADGEAITDENGEFEINYVFDENKTSGAYVFVLDGDFVISPLSIDVMYITRAKEKELLDTISKITKGEDVEEFLKDYESIMGLDLLNDLKNVPEADPVYEKMIGKSYEDAEALRETFYTLVALETINQATDKEVADIVLTSEKDCARLGLDYERIHLIKDNYDAFLEEVVGLKNATDTKELKELINPVVEKWAAKEYGFSDVTISEKDKTVYKGQGIEISLEFKDDVNNLKSAEFEIEVSDADMLLYMETDAEESVTLEEKTENGIKKILAVYEDDEPIKKLGTLYLTAPQETGKFTVTLDGKCEFENEDGIKFITNILEKTINVTVTNPKNTDSSGGGSRPTSSSSGRGGAGSSSGNMTVSQYKDELDDKKEELEAKEYKFSDLSNVSWAEDSIYALLEKGIISESEDKLFNPERNITREEFVKMLVLSLGFNPSNEKCTFEDVKEDAWYYQYVAVAQINGLVNGNEKNEFGAGEFITRQDMSAIVARALLKLSYNSSYDGEKFADDAEISEYAKEAVYMMKKEGIINGVGDNRFAPKDNATRAQAAKIINGVVLAAKK